jgi:hypothetical protein
MIEYIKDEKNWYKKCQLIKKYHEEQCALHSTKRREKWTMKDTATAIGISAGYVSESIRLAESHEIYGKLSREAALRVIKGRG